jgi:hypothetical protein
MHFSDGKRSAKVRDQTARIAQHITRYLLNEKEG